MFDIGGGATKHIHMHSSVFIGNSSVHYILGRFTVSKYISMNNMYESPDGDLFPDGVFHKTLWAEHDICFRFTFVSQWFDLYLDAWNLTLSLDEQLYHDDLLYISMLET